MLQALRRRCSQGYMGGIIDAGMMAIGPNKRYCRGHGHGHGYMVTADGTAQAQAIWQTVGVKTCKYRPP